jgi:hypothetical protein
LGPVSRADPATISMPIASKRAGSSSLPAMSYWTARIRFQTRDRSMVGSTASMPNSSAVRM